VKRCFGGQETPADRFPVEHSEAEQRRGTFVCAGCGGHPGHSIPDWPRPACLRYCMNGVARAFAPDT